MTDWRAGWVSASLWVIACGGSSELPEDASGGATAGGAAGSAVSAGASGVATTAGSSAVTGGVSGVAGASSLGGEAGVSAAGAAGTGGAPLGSCDGKSSALAPWPGGADVTTLEPEAQFQANLSGLTYDPERDALWAVDNIPGRLFRLLPSGSGFVTDAAGGWSDGKELRYPGGASAPDAEGVTFGADSEVVYVCSEHDNQAASTSRQSLLRFEVNGAGATLTATHDWNLTSILPKAGANSGIEGVTFLPDAYLTSRGFFDEARQSAYDPAQYGEHGGGLFVVGVEESGRLYVLALDHVKIAATLVATIITPNPGVMGLELDRDNEQLWFHCDETCENQSGILDIDTVAGSPTLGRFVVVRRFERPTGLPDSNHEGIAIGPASACEDGLKPFFWTDDADVDGFSLRRGTIPCTRCP